MKMARNAFCTLVERALADLPAEFQRRLEELSVDVQDEPDPQTIRALDLDDPGSLLGLYHGEPLTDRSVTQPEGWPDRIIIYQRNIERACRNKSEIVEQVRTTVLHELGHHFGLDEDELEELGYG